MTMPEIIAHVRHRTYMSGLQRDGMRSKATNEVFTPTELVHGMLDQLPQELFSDPCKTFCDPSCGDGQFLSEILIRKLENGIDIAQALRTIYGVDIMRDNVDLCRERLACGRDDLKKIVKHNIVCRDSLRSSWRFMKNNS